MKKYKNHSYNLIGDLLDIVAETEGENGTMIVCATITYPGDDRTFNDKEIKRIVESFQKDWLGSVMEYNAKVEIR